MNIPTCITPDTAAVTVIVDVSKLKGKVGCLSAIGTLQGSEVVTVQRPLIDDPDPDNDAHWTTLSLNDTEVTLRVGHDAEPIPVPLILRISKPITATAVGVGWS